MQTHPWRKEATSHVARVAIGDLVQFELHVTDATWWIVVDGAERKRGVCTTQRSTATTTGAMWFASSGSTT